MTAARRARRVPCRPCIWSRPSIWFPTGVRRRKWLLEDGCAGTPTTPILNADIGRKSKKLIETIEGTRSSRRIDSWKVEAATPCQFQLVHSGEQEIESGDGKSYRVDLATNQGDVQDTGTPQPRQPVNDGDLDAAAKSTGWKRAGNGNVHGAACENWKAPTGGDLSCVWTGGTKWGFSRAGINALDGDGVTSDGAIVLQATPPQNGFGWTVQTRQFHSGQGGGRVHVRRARQRQSRPQLRGQGHDPNVKAQPTRPKPGRDGDRLHRHRAHVPGDQPSG